MAEEKKERKFPDEPMQMEGPGKAAPGKEGQGKEAPGKEARPPKVKKKGGSKMIIIIIFFIIVAAAAGGYFMFGKKFLAGYLGKTPAGKETVQRKENVGPILQLEPFVFNLAGNQSKYAKVSLGIEVKDVKAMEETKKLVPVIRDRILFIFGTKAPEVLMDVNQRESIKKEVHGSLKTVFKSDDELKAVYITDIIIQ